MMGVSDNKKIGMFMAGLGGVFMFLGVILFFDSALLGLGNVLFLGAFPFLIGVRKTMALFNPMARNARPRGIVAFFGGFVLIIVGWGVTGFFLELFGLLDMFGAFLVSILSYASNIPVIGPVLTSEPVRKFLSMFSSKQRSSMV